MEVTHPSITSSPRVGKSMSRSVFLDAHSSSQCSPLRAPSIRSVTLGCRAPHPPGEARVAPPLSTPPMSRALLGALRLRALLLILDHNYAPSIKCGRIRATIISRTQTRRFLPGMRPLEDRWGARLTHTQGPPCVEVGRAHKIRSARALYKWSCHQPPTHRGLLVPAA